MNKLVVIGLIVISLTKIVEAQKTVLINIRGASKIFAERSFKENSFDEQSAFRFLEKNAKISTILEPVPNAVTAVNNATLETGVYPETHGIVGNAFGRFINGKFENASGFGSPFQSETIWEKAVRNGKKVIRLGTLQINGFGQNDFQIPTLPQVAPLTESQNVTLAPVDCEYEFSAKPAKFQCYSDKKTLTFGSFKKSLYFIAIGEFLLIDEDSRESNGFLAKIKQGDWFALELARQDSATVGLYAKLLKLNNDSNDLKIYFGPAFRNNGYPKSFVETIEKNVGLTVGGPDYAGYLQGRIDLETLLEQAHRETEFMQKVAVFCLKNLEFDLLIYDHPILDRYGHYTGGTDFEQLKNGYAATDKNLLEILQTIDQTDSLAIVSGHGFSAAHTSFSFRNLFENLKIKISPTENADVSVFASKLSAHIYLNNRSLSRPEKQKYLHGLRKKLLNFKDDKSGARIIDKVLFPDEIKRLRLYNQQNSGDLWICLKPGYTFDGIISTNQLRGKPAFIGEHGYFDKSAESKGLFYFHGPKRPKTSPNPKDGTFIARMIFELLKID